MLGNLIPLLNPIRVAEEYAMIDVMSGRVADRRHDPRRAARIHRLQRRARPSSRERLREAAALIVKCWTEPEPFGWEGEFYQYPFGVDLAEANAAAASADPDVGEQRGVRRVRRNSIAP